MSKRLPAKAKQKIVEVIQMLEQEYPKVECALNYKSPFQLLCATILAAQCTDKRVNLVTPKLFNKWPTPELLSSAELLEIEEIIYSTGFYRAKARNLLNMAQRVCDVYAGEIPKDMKDLTSLAGVGRKTANVVRSECFNLPGLPVDTHVTRISQKLKLTNNDDAVNIEKDLCKMIPENEWRNFSLRLIEHGRNVCDAKKPKCDQCVLVEYCSAAYPQI